MPAAPPGYPSRWEADVILSDGGVIHVRPIRPDDADGITALHSRLSADTVYLRFFTPLPRLSPALLARFVNVDYTDRVALVAGLGDDLIGVARYDRRPGTAEAEVAFVIEDDHQGRGIATLLLEHLAAMARENGIRRFVAETLAGNERMLGVFHDAGFADERRFDHGIIQVAFDIEPTDASVAAMHGRERRAAARSVARLLNPRSIAVVGAGRESTNLGHRVFHNLLAGGFVGPVYPVHPSAHHVASVRAFPTVLDVPDHIDLAVLAVPGSAVPEVVEQCARKGVGGLLVLSNGFAESGPEGAAAERQLVEQARRHGMRVIGPYCMGVLNTAAGVRMNATVADLDLPPGRIGFMSQSGALGIAILEEARTRGLGVSTFVAAGNKADVSGNDLLQYWEDDDGTDVVLLYLESFGNPRTFSRVARRVSRRKPIVAVKSGRTPSGARGVAQGTGSDIAVAALFAQTGVLRVDSLEQLFDVAQALAHQPLPRGRRVAIVGNTRGPGVIAADACEAAGLEVPELSERTQQALRTSLPASTGVRNPVHLPPLVQAGHFERALQIALEDPGIDAALVIFFPPLEVTADQVAAEIAGAAAASGKPVVANFLATRGMLPGLRAGGHSVPSYAFPEAAAAALARMADRAEWLARPVGLVPDLDIDLAAVRQLVEDAVASGPDPIDLSGEAAQPLLAAYGIEVLATGAAPAPEGVPATVRLALDPSFGPLLGLSIGGGPVELPGDRAWRVLPLTDVDAAELAGAPRGAPLLHAADGAAHGDPAPAAMLEALLLRVGRLADDLPEVVELCLDAVVVTAERAVASGVRLRLSPATAHPELAMRRLR